MGGKKYLVIVVLTWMLCGGVVLGFAAASLRADVAPSIPWGSRCEADESEILCKQVLKDYSAPLTNTCKPYEKSEGYRLLTYKKEFVNDTVVMDFVYCKKSNTGALQSRDIFMNLFGAKFFPDYLILLVTTLVLELAYLRAVRLLTSMKDYLFAAAVNFISVFALSTSSSMPGWNRWLVLSVGEIGVFLFEATFLVLLLPVRPRSKIAKNVFMANLVSLVIGSIIVYGIWQWR